MSTDIIISLDDNVNDSVIITEGSHFVNHLIFETQTILKKEYPLIYEKAFECVDGGIVSIYSLDEEEFMVLYSITRKFYEKFLKENNSPKKLEDLFTIAKIWGEYINMLESDPRFNK